jgi:flap endonuclease-1
MGVNLRELIEPHGIDWSELRGKKIAIDAMNTLYQFLSTIRQPDGTPLMDLNGKITSHLTGLFYRTARIYESGVKPVYVFDGRPPDLKGRELDERRERKQKAEEKWLEAKEMGDMEEARKQAMRTSRFTKEMLDDAKSLISAMGLPYIDAPAEGEAQCAHMCMQGDVYATCSQDYDSLLAGTPLLMRNMAMQEKFPLEKVDLDENLTKLGISREQLVDIAILCGTDFNRGGMKGIGPKKGLQIVKSGKMGEYAEALGEKYGMIRKIFLEPEVSGDYTLAWEKPDPDAIKKILIDAHGFSEMRVQRGIERLGESYNKNVSQSSLSQWF